MSTTKIKVQGASVNTVKEVSGASITFRELKSLFSNIDFSKNRVYIAPDLDREITGDNFVINFADYTTNGQIRVGIVQKDMKQGARTRAEVIADVKAIRAKSGHGSFASNYPTSSTADLEVAVSRWVCSYGPVNPAAPATLNADQTTAIRTMKRIAGEVSTLSGQLVAKLNEFEAISSSFGGMTDDAFAAQLAALARR